MNQIGPVFREARTRSGKTIEEAVRETKIAKKYLNAIENENFDIFPGETYLIGFLRNYAQFLGLDPDEMVLKYKDYKIQEQPAPIEQLTARPRNTKRYFLVVVICVMIVSVVLYVFFLGRRGDQKIATKMEDKVEQKNVQTQKKDDTVVVFEEEEVIKDFKKGEVIAFPLRNSRYEVTIDGIEETFDFSIEDIPFSLSNDEHVEIDFDRDGRKDLMIRPNSFGEGTVNLTLKKLYRSDLQEKDMGPSVDIEGDKTQLSGGPPEVVIIREEGLLSQLPIAPKTGFQIVSSYEKTEINMLAQTQSITYIGYYVDDGSKEETLLKNGDQLSVMAKDVLRITAANAGNVDIKINDIPLSLGDKGQVVAKVIRWYRDSESNELYHLVIDEWEK